MTDRQLRIVRALALAAGSILSLIFLLADSFGFSAPGSVGEGQVLVGIFGLFLLLAGIAGRRFLLVWRILGFVILICMVTALVFGSARAFLHALLPGSESESICVLRADVLDCGSRVLLYKPHVLWIGADSRDPWSTEEEPCDVSGGVVWLYGSEPDSADVSSESYLPELLCSEEALLVDRRQPCFNSTQSLILLMLDLRDHAAPDTVIMLAGQTDIDAALSSGDPRWPLGSSGFLAGIRSSDNLSMNLSGSELASAAARVQNVNRTVLEALGEEYGFEVVFVWMSDPVMAADSSHDLPRSLRSMVDSLMAEPEEI